MHLLPAALPQALLGVLAFYVLVAVLYAVVPGPRVAGYVVDDRGQPLPYQLNGLRVLFAVLFLLFWLDQLSYFSLTLVYAHFTEAMLAAFVIGMTASVALLIKGRSLPKLNHARRANTVDRPNYEDKEKPAAKWNLLQQFFAGLEFNPRVGLWDYKMYLYLVGAAMLEVVVLSAVATQQQEQGAVGHALLVYAAMMSWFVVEYLYHEHVHLYTYDFFAERVGFKLAWGCLTFYPFFYSIGVHALVPATADISVIQAVVIALLFLVGWIITRGANNQKYYFKIAPQLSYFGFRQTEGSILMVGWWGAARHFNYCGEILQAVALALPGWLVSGSLVPWLYPLYYVALLGTRQLDDDALCAAKYGKKWDDYVAAVPYRIVPYVW